MSRLQTMEEIRWALAYHLMENRGVVHGALASGAALAAHPFDDPPAPVPRRRLRRPVRKMSRRFSTELQKEHVISDPAVLSNLIGSTFKVYSHLAIRYQDPYYIERFDDTFTLFASQMMELGYIPSD